MSLRQKQNVTLEAVDEGSDRTGTAEFLDTSGRTYDLVGSGFKQALLLREETASVIS